MIGLLLAHSMGVIIPRFNFLYFQWDMAAKMSAVAVFLLTGLWWLIRRDDSAVRTSVLEIKQALATIFIQTVIDESH